VLELVGTFVFALTLETLIGRRASGLFTKHDGPRKSAWNGMNEGTKGRGVVSAHEVENRCET
jgi:hypothetical protein